MGPGYDLARMDRKADADVVDRLLAREEEALRGVIADYGPVVYGVARRIVAEPSLAEEVAQDTFLALWRRPGSYDPERGSLLAFLAGVARNKAIDLVRREETMRRTKDALAAEMDLLSARFDSGSYEGIERRHEVKNALAKLSDLQREAIVLAYFGGRTYKEVARELAIPEGTAKTRLRDGLIKLRQLMAT
ncbi:MAG: sigma-70 family RNA polymerase sigma factor [Actinomycetota bacterium]